MAVFRVLSCAVDAVPCPAESQVWVTVAETVDYAALGVTPAELLFTFTWGAGAVLALWAVGYAVGAAAKAIQRM
jgi:hypothetical protein